MDEMLEHYYCYDTKVFGSILDDVRVQCIDASFESGNAVILHMHPYDDNKCDMKKSMHERYEKGVRVNE